MPKKPKFDPAEAITNELIRIIERGTLPWRRPWRVAGSSMPLRHTGEPYQGINNFLLTLRTQIMGYASPYWMTMRQANELDARVIKGQKSSIVIYYGTSYKDAAKGGTETDGEAGATADDTQKQIPFMKSYRVFNADQIEGLPDKFHPKPEVDDSAKTPTNEPIPHMKKFFDDIGADVVIAGREACYMPALDRIYMPPLEVFESSEKFYAVMAHEHGHWSGVRHRLNRDFGHARFGNTAYIRDEIVAELASVFLGQHLGFTPYQLETNAAYLDSWIRVLRSDKRAIFAHAGDAMRACEFLIKASEAGAQDVAA